MAQSELAELGLFMRARLVLSLVNGMRTMRVADFGRDWSAEEEDGEGLEYVLATQKIGQQLLEVRGWG